MRGKLFWDVTASASLDAFLEESRQKWMQDTSLDEWILEAGNAYIVEKRSSWDGAADRGLYSRLYGDAALQNHILPLLAVSQDSIYVIVNSASITYGIVDCYVDRIPHSTQKSLVSSGRNWKVLQISRKNLSICGTASQSLTNADSL